ncbi:MAG: cytochrome c biogenesis protein CcdA, partial [Gemmatimonadota bacterium]
MDSLGIGFTAAFAAGLLSFLSPCVLPLVPSYLSFVTGLGMEELESGDAELRRTTLIHSLLFVAGFSSIFLALGASASFLGQILREYQLWIARIGGVIVLFFGLHLLGLTPLRWLQRERRMHLERKPVGYIGSFVVGVTFGAGWTPCIGPILGGILTFAATRQTLGEGVQLLAFYSAGLAVPFILSAVGFTWFLATFKRL